ncbi:MAG: FtsX-like permease family protein [Verrucomicrobia bacterium]|nr:FtsX-like permease family protein [Verrucomicrobiota bacterium]
MTPRFGALFFRQVIRPTLRHPLLPLLNILSIGLGVAVFLAIQIANRGALASFQNSVGLVAGRAHLEIRGDIPDSVHPAVAGFPGIRSATPLVEGIITLPDQPGEYLRLLGVDPFTGDRLRVFEIGAPDGTSLDLEAWLREPLAVAVSNSRNAPFRVLAAGKSVELHPRFVIRTDETTIESDDRLAAMDIGWAQELLGLQNRLTSIQIELDDPLQADAMIPGLQKLVPPDVTVAPPARRGAETESMLAAFQLNLTALSLVSMVVGVFLIYNSLSATVVRRRVEIGILRANGATKAEISALFLGDGLLCGLVGSALGILIAGPLAHLLAAPVGQTVSSLYALVSVGHLAITPSQVGLAFLVGTGAALLASWHPASEAAACNPVDVLHPGSTMTAFSFRSGKWLLPGLGLLAIAGASAWSAFQGGGKHLGFASVALLIAGFSLIVPAVVVSACRLMKFRSWMMRLGVQHLVRSLHRSAVTIAALAVAAAMTVSVSVMIHSFRGSVSAWLEKTLVADLFIAPAANEIAGLQSFIPADAVEWARHNRLVKETGTFREIQVLLNGQPAAMGVVEGGARGKLVFLSGNEDAGTLFHSSGHVVVSESFANRRGTRPGDVLMLASPQGPLTFRVAGVVKDFTRDSGLIMMDRRNFDRAWNDPRVHSLAITLHDPALAASLAAEFRNQFGKSGEYSIYTNASLRRRVMDIFDQTFAVTSVLRAIAVLVAVAGVVLSLTTLIIEREREIGILRSQGASPGQIKGLVFTEAGLIGLFASLVGIACGAAMAMVLTWVINKAFFGWTIELRYPLDVLFGTPLWIIPAAIAAAWLPALRASRIPPAQALRFE